MRKAEPSDHPEAVRMGPTEKMIEENPDPGGGAIINIVFEKD